MERLLKSTLWRTLGYLVLLELMLFAAVWYWPSFRDNIPALKMMARLPVLEDLVGQMADKGYYAYVYGQHFFKGCNTLGVAAAILFAMGAIAGEAHRGTMEIWLSRPLSRRRLLLERYASGLFGVCVPVFVTSATLPWLSDMVDEQLGLRPALLGAVHQSAFLAVIYSVTFFLSSISSQPSKIAFVMLFLTTFEFALYMIKTVTHWSIFRLTDIEAYDAIHTTGTLEWGRLAAFVGISALFCVGSAVAFSRRVP